MFTIIIPLFDKALYIEKAIRTVLDQTYRDFELIVVNDGSTDGGDRKAALFEDERLVIVNQVNAGVSSARNAGVKLAKYEYIVFLDADDWWDLTFLSNMYELITDYPEASLYGCNYYIHKNGMNTPAKVGLEKHFLAGYIDYFTVYSTTFWVPINCSFVVLTKTIFNALGGFKPALKFGEDLDLWIRIALRSKVAYLNKYLSYSNQDVLATSRALGTEKRWSTQEHVLFNLAYLSAEEKRHPQLKFLLDRLRLSALVDYHLNSWYPDEVANIICSIDFSNHPAAYRFVYHWPIPLVTGSFHFKKVGSVVKQLLLRNFRQIVLRKSPLL